MLRIAVSDEDGMSRLIQQQFSEYVSGEQTCGDGACGVHAIFGVSSSHGLLAERARELALELLSSAWRVEDQPSRISMSMQIIRQSFLHEFLMPVLSAQNRAPSPEGEIYWGILRDKFPQEAQEMQDYVLGKPALDAELQRLKKQLFTSSTALFSMEHETLLVRPIAVALKLIPTDVDVFGIQDFDLLRQQHPDSHDFLLPAQSAVGCVVADSMPFPDQGPSCMYKALFDPREEFDGIRQHFIECRGREVFFEHLAHRLHLPSNRSPDLEDFSKAVEALRRLSLHDVEPASFSGVCWETYFATILHQTYYFSPEELIVMSFAANKNVIIFEQTNDVLRHHISYLDGEGPIISVKLNSNRFGAVRGHFERLVNVTKKAEPAARKDVSDSTSGPSNTKPRHSPPLCSHWWGESKFCSDFGSGRSCRSCVHRDSSRDRVVYRDILIPIPFFGYL